ncbi:MAG: hypothetical protein ACI4PM_07840 [Butyricicoccus sp.]
MILFETPQACSGAANPMDAVVDAVGALFEQINILFQREPEQFDCLSSGAVLVPLYAAEQLGDGELREQLLTLLFDNLDYPFSRQAFDAYLSQTDTLPDYTERIHPTLNGHTFWNAVGQCAEPEQGNAILKAFASMLGALFVKNPEVVCSEVTAACNYSRLQAACETEYTAEQAVKSLLQCYHTMMEHSEEMQAEEQEFLVHCLILYSLQEIGCLDAAAALPIRLMLSAEGFQSMMSEESNCVELDRLFACSAAHAGQFWKMAYAAAVQAGDDTQVAVLALWLERFLLQTAETPGQKEKAKQHRNILFSLVI